jgi:hypothetical protein
MSSTAHELASGASTPSTFKRPKISTGSTDEDPADVVAAAAAAAAASTEPPASHSHYPYSYYPYDYDYSAYAQEHHHPHEQAYSHGRHHGHGHGHHGLEAAGAEHESSAVVSPPDQDGSGHHHHHHQGADGVAGTPNGGAAASGGDMPPLSSYAYDQPYSYYYPPPHLMHVAPSPVNAASSLANMASQSSPENRKRKASYDHEQQQQQQHSEGAGGGYYGQGPYAGAAPDDGAGPYAEEDEDDGERIIFRLYCDADRETLSERHCYVRQCYIQAFTATASDVSSRHSKGAQKLNAGQVGVRCVFCSHLPHGDRAERAVCYPRSISRLYQTVADMQRFHFESCVCIPSRMRETYQALKTSRKRGQEKPQEYWIRSARELGLYDSPDGGIFYDAARAVGVPYNAAAAADAAAADAAAADAAAADAAAAEAAANEPGEYGEDKGVEKEGGVTAGGIAV